jgi:ABC-type spermidine/putrescine transport system permease subunit I
VCRPSSSQLDRGGDQTTTGSGSGTFKVSLITTAACAAISYPTAYFWRASGSAIGAAAVLLFLPFWVSYIIRTIAWISVLGRPAVNTVLISIGLIDEPLKMLYNGLGHGPGLFPGACIINVYVSLDGIDATSSLGAHARPRRGRRSAGDAAVIAAGLGTGRAVLRAGGRLS